jgi:hypothetical protein
VILMRALAKLGEFRPFQALGGGCFRDYQPSLQQNHIGRQPRRGRHLRRRTLLPPDPKHALRFTDRTKSRPQFRAQAPPGHTAVLSFELSIRRADALIGQT